MTPSEIRSLSRAQRQTTTSIAANNTTATRPLLSPRQILQPRHRAIHVPRSGGWKAKDPKTLHKYLYAGGDPINAVDPTGKGIIEYVWTNVRSAALGVLEGHKYGEIVLCLLNS